MWTRFLRSNLTQEEADDPRSLAAKAFPTRKVGFALGFYQTFKEGTIAVTYKFFKKKIEEEGRFSNSFYDAGILLILKPKTIQENYRQLPPTNTNAKTKFQQVEISNV